MDNKLVHVLPPNIYRTPSESLQAFDYISKVGNFNIFERVAAKYLGAFGMYFIAKLLKKKYQLDSDVRSSLYRYCNKWCKAIGKDRQFMGGKQPNLADLVSAVMIHQLGGVSTLFEVWCCCLRGFCLHMSIQGKGSACIYIGEMMHVVKSLIKVGRKM